MASSSVTRTRAPLAPIGWPSATAPPWTFIFSCGMPRSFIAAMGTDGERLVDLEQVHVVHVQPQLSAPALAMAPMGARVNHSGSRENGGVAEDSGLGLDPQFLGRFSATTTTAAARRR